MDYRVERLRTPTECELFALNAIDRKRPDLASEARRKAVNLQAAAHGAGSQLEAEAFAALYAYETLLTRKNGKKTRATKSWATIKSHGAIAAIRELVGRVSEPEVLAGLRDLGLESFAFEALVLRHETAFDEATVKVSKARLAPG